MPLQTDYRPTSFKNLLGNQDVAEAVKASLSRDNHNHCFLLTGNSGCGKTTLSYLIGKALGVYDFDSNNNPNFKEINSSDFRGIDTVRGIRAESQKAPLSGGVRVFFLDECHKLTGDAQEAYLALLEKADTTPNYYIFATTNPEMLKPTFKRRCAHYELKPIADTDLSEELNSICEEENITVPENVIDFIVSASSGSLGIALAQLDAIMGVSPEKMLQIAEKQASVHNQTIDLCRVLANPKSKWKDVATILQGLRNEDPEKTRRTILGYSANWLLKQDNNKAFIMLDAFIEPFYNTGFPGVVHACHMVLNSK